MNLESTAVVPAYRICDGQHGVGDPRGAAIAAWRGSLGDDDALLGARYDAMCLHSPFGRPVFRFVEHVDDGIVGLLALAPRRMRAGGRELLAGVLSHLAIHPRHRSLGPALMLLESVLAAAEQHFDLVYGIPNASQGANAALRRAGLCPLAGMERSAGAAAPWRACGFRPRGEQQVVVRWIDPGLAADPPPPHLTYIDQDG
ncbi:hypothetical protein [Luteimonas changyuni]|uniref:hypothetical protein n=1 Tax=Luteimonas sp. MJ145 TaxID=3129234 RepID=UPI0031BA3629